MVEFNLVNEYVLSRLGAKNKVVDNRFTIVETERRSKCEMSYGFIHMIWIIQFNDGSVIASIPLNVSEEIKSFLLENNNKIDIMNESFILTMKKLTDREANKLYSKDSCRCFSDVVFACNSRSMAKVNTSVTTVRLTDKNIECCNDIGFPDHCLPDGIIYGVIESNKIVSLAHAHKTGEYQDIVADIGVETSIDYRHRGFARECVNSVARHVINNGGESIYKCSPDNVASIHTALSSGYKPYGKSLIFSVVP